MDQLLSAEFAIIAFVQSLGTWMVPLMKAFTFLSTVEFYLLWMPLLYWCWDATLGLRMGIMLMLTAGLNEALKMAFRRPRPYWIPGSEQQIQAMSAEESFAFPSGHAQQAMSLWGLLAASLRRNWMWAIALLVALFNGLSRVYLGVHYLSDVLVGWALGGVLLWAFLRLEAPVAGWWARQTWRVQLAASLLASIAVLSLALLARASLGDWQVPGAWFETALAQTGEPIDPLAAENAVDAAGVLLGMACGATWLARRGWFRASGPAAKRLLRYVMGLLGLLGLWFGGRALLPEATSATVYGLRYLRSAVVGVWVSAAAPALFVRLGLAERSASGS
jgi:membrane-associated phospholipid phosphatase